jgi:tetratricopeptide (TPR) repeat protein
MTTGEPDKCREVLNDALNLHPHSAQLLTNQALLERQTGEIEGSLNDFRKALEADPTYGFAASDLGTTLFQLQRYSDAVDALTQAVNLRPHDQLPWQALAQSYLKVGSANDALPKLQKILDAHPDSAAGWVAVGAMQDMASIDPTASYQKATQLDPKFGAAWDGLGLAYARHNKLPEALDAFSQAVKVNPDGPQWWNDLGYCQLVEGMVDPAIASFQNSLRRSPKFTRPMVNLAQAYAMKGEKELMQETLTRLDQVDPDLGAKTRQRFQSN